MSETQHVCPEPAYGMLPFIIHDAAVKGHVDRVISWLQGGGDINATDMYGRTLVFLACDNNFDHLLKELLKQPGVHLNQYITKSYSSNANQPGMVVGFGCSAPMGVACSKGHVKCVEALLSSPSECKLDLYKEFTRNSQYPVIAANNNHWTVVNLILKAGFILRKDSPGVLLCLAIAANERDIVRYIIQQDISYTPQHFQLVIRQCYQQNMWDDVGADVLFKKAIHNHCDSSTAVLSLVLEDRDWNRLENLLKMMTDKVKINIALAEAVLAKTSTDDIARMFEGDPSEETVVNGTLLVASIGGTSDQIADVLLSEKFKYSQEIMDNALILASQNGRIELLPALFKRGSFNNTTLSRAKVVSRNFFGNQLLTRALKKAAKEIIHIDGESEDEEEKETE